MSASKSTHDARCSAKQVSDAILIWSSLNGSNPVLCYDYEEAEKLKCLDLFISTLVVFSDAFSTEMDHSYDEFLEQPTLSKTSFIEYLKPRVVSLAEKNGYFDFMLVCAYVSRIIKSRALSHNCFHMARVACDLLTRILEVKFREIFSDWNNLMSFCRKIHAAVFLSHKAYLKDFDKKEVLKEIENIKKEEFDENKVSEQKRHKRNGQFLTESVNLLSVKEKSSDSHSLKDDSLDSKSIKDDTTYWEYFNLDLSVICERITYSESHLKDVYKRLKKLKDDVDTESLSSNEYDISFGNDDYIEELELSSIDPEIIFISGSMKKKCANKICEEENEKLGDASRQHRVYPENITDARILEYIFNTLARAKCELCYGKMRAFIEYWSERFREDYKEFSNVTNVF